MKTNISEGILEEVDVYVCDSLVGPLGPTFLGSDSAH